MELRAYNESYPAGVAATVTVHVVAAAGALRGAEQHQPGAALQFVGHGGHEHPGRGGCGDVPGALVLVSNGVYQTGARAVYGMSNRVAVTKPVTVRSVNGPEVTDHCRLPGAGNDQWAGGGAVCVSDQRGGAGGLYADQWRDANAPAIGHETDRGGGVWCESASAVVSNCVLTGNSAALTAAGPTLARSTTAR